MKTFTYLNLKELKNTLAVAVAQLVELSLSRPEICGSNLDIGKILPTNCSIEKKDGNKEKEAGNGPS